MRSTALMDTSSLCARPSEASVLASSRRASERDLVACGRGILSGHSLNQGSG